ncbi:hypothetical protein [Delftia tsuruhatensis]|uniref:hypothetical protein n=1 Tax=Delftia tsuruhatensis TaxID=180282 RepID=UPI0030D486A6
MLRSPQRRFLLLLTFLGIAYALWLLAFWPGVLGQDSLAIMLEVETDRVAQAGKPAFWYLYNLWLYGPWRLVEAPIIVQMCVSTIVSARILSWMLGQRLYKSFWYCLFFVTLAPSVLYYSIALYSDGIYAMAMMGMLFEIWLCYRARRIDAVACGMLALTIPFALFARPNGFINTIGLVALFFVLPRLHRWKLLAVTLPWCAIALFANTQYKYHTPIGSVFPLALYETVGFMEHRPMGLWEYDKPRISDKSVEALTSTGKSLAHILKFHDHYYWDPLIFSDEGPALLHLPKQAKKTIVKEFFKYNLWHNFPAFMASRVNIFTYAALANGGLPPPEAAQYILSQTKSESSILFRELLPHQILMPWYNFALEYRAIFWAPWLGLFLILATTAKAWRLRDRSGLVVCSVFVLQLTAVFFFSIAGEYRYLLSFFTAPLVLLPVFTSLSSSPSSTAATPSGNVKKISDKLPQSGASGPSIRIKNSLSHRLIRSNEKSQLWPRILASNFMRRKLGFYFSVLWLAFVLIAATKRLIRFFPPPDAEINGDAYWTYLPNARKLLDQPWTFLTTDPSSYHVAPLGYMWAALWDVDPARIQLANCVLFLTCILLMWRCAILLGGLWAGVVATALLVFFPVLASFVPQVLTESPYLFGLMLCTTAATEYALGNRRPRMMLGLFAAGLTITLLSRPVLQLFALGGLIAALAFTILCARRAHPTRGVMARLAKYINHRLCVALLAALLLPAAVVVKNGLCFGVWGLGTGAGSGLYYGLSPFKMGLEPVYSGFKYDAGITPLTAAPHTRGNPLHSDADRVNARVAMDIAKNTSLQDNASFFAGKLKAWLFYSTPELRIASKLRSLRTFEWLAIVLAALALALRTLGARRAPAQARQPLPGPQGTDGEKLVVLSLLLLLVLGMALQLTPVLYNTRYNLFFLEPWLMLLCGVSIAVLLQWPAGPMRGGTAGARTWWRKWLPGKILVAVLLAALPPALTRHAVRHETWNMNPYRPGPVQTLLDRDAMGPVRAVNATALQDDQWRLEASPATLLIPLRVMDAAALAPHSILDAIWRLRFAVSAPEAPRACRKAALQLSNGHQPQGWYTPEAALPIQLDGEPHTYAFHGNDNLRPAGDGDLLVSFNCPPGTVVTWHGAELLRSTLPEAARALIQQGVPIDPYYRHEPR